jgi:hypothetical protein
MSSMVQMHWLGQGKEKTLNPFFSFRPFFHFSQPQNPLTHEIWQRSYHWISHKNFPKSLPVARNLQRFGWMQSIEGDLVA